jgi:uncharacterized protein (TIGR03382 family)
MRNQALWALAVAGVAVGAGSAMADYSRDITISAHYAMTDANGNPIAGAGGVPLTTQVSHTFNLDTDFVRQGTDSSGTEWWQYVGNERLGDHTNPSHSPFVNGIQIGIREDPMVVANFNVAAGIVNTTFTVTSSLVSFPSITNGSAIASAALSVTDSATFGDVGQVSITGLQSGGNAFTSRFNGGALTFANLIQSGAQSIAAGGTHTFNGSSLSFPAYDLVPGSVVDIQSEFSFTLSRFDRAAGTSTFEIIPAPGALTLLGLGGLLAARRRRSN